MTDHAAALRQQYISDYARLEAKREQLRQRLHAEGKALLCEENAARKSGWQIWSAAGKYTKGSK